jgi:hypothetical protein
VPAALSRGERQLLRHYEQRVQSGQRGRLPAPGRGFYEVGKALLAICDGRFYRETHDTFEEYCRERLGMTRSCAYRQIAAARIVDRIGPTPIPPRFEAQIRCLSPLLDVPDANLASIWQEAVATSPSGRVSARWVQAAAERIYGGRPGPGDRRFGEPIDAGCLRHAPINEQGVVFLFGIMARELGFVVDSVQGGFPDCVAKRCTDPRRNRWKEVRIEFEHCSHNFVTHGHPISGCDLIVCWIHDWWWDCPFEVVSLRDELKRRAGGTAPGP